MVAVLRRVVDQDQVEVGGETHLAAAETPHRDHGEFAARHGAVLAGEIGGDQRHHRPEHGLGDVGEHRPRRRTVEIAAEELDADLKAPLIGPAPRQVERLLEMPRPGENSVEVGSEPAPIRQRREEIGAQHRLEQRRAARQIVGETRHLGHDVGDQLQQSGIGVEQRKQLHPGR